MYNKPDTHHDAAEILTLSDEPKEMTPKIWPICVCFYKSWAHAVPKTQGYRSNNSRKRLRILRNLRTKIKPWIRRGDGEKDWKKTTPGGSFPCNKKDAAQPTASPSLSIPFFQSIDGINEAYSFAAFDFRWITDGQTNGCFDTIKGLFERGVLRTATIAFTVHTNMLPIQIEIATDIFLDCGLLPSWGSNR